MIGNALRAKKRGGNLLKDGTIAGRGGAEKTDQGWGGKTAAKRAVSATTK